jgi:hypothetical protein
MCAPSLHVHAESHAESLLVYHVILSISDEVLGIIDAFTDSCCNVNVSLLCWPVVGSCWMSVDSCRKMGKHGFTFSSDEHTEAGK